MIHLGGMDWVRGLICFFFLFGLIYILFPKSIQSYSVRVIIEASLAKIRSIGAFSIVIGIVLWVIFSKSFG